MKRTPVQFLYKLTKEKAFKKYFRKRLNKV